MRYLVLLLGDGDEPAWSTLDPDQQAEVMTSFEAFSAACSGREGVQILAGEALAGPDAVTVMRTRGGQVQLTDGPYAEAVEGLGGFYLIEAPDLDVLVELLEVLPDYDIQISPAVDPTG